MNIQSCFLQDIKSNEKIILTEGCSVFIGRNELTKIKDLMVSKKHLCVRADYKTGELHVKAIGKILPRINYLKCKRDICYKVGQGAVVELVPNGINLKVVFEPKPNTDFGKDCEIHSTQMSEASGSSLIGEDDNSLWRTIDCHKLLLFRPKGITGKPLVAAFDLDGTIITTASGARFPKNSKDWKILYNSTDKIREVYAKDHNVVFFTNQAGLGNDKKKIDQFKSKIENILDTLKVPVQVFISTTKSLYRKPATKMWEVYQSNFNDGVPIDLEKSFYVGDAAGRPENWAPGKKKDFSCSDRLFALNIGVTFYTPDEYFLNQPPAEFIMPDFDPRNISANRNVGYADISSGNQEVVIMVGIQGSGKSSFCQNYLIPKGYEVVSNDKYGSLQKTCKVMEKAIAAGKSVVVDNTNPDQDSRKPFIQIAKSHGLPLRCFLMRTSLDQAQHNLKIRQFYIKVHGPFVPDAAINLYKKKYKKPELKEGFNEVVEIDFVPIFASDEEESCYKKFIF